MQIASSQHYEFPNHVLLAGNRRCFPFVRSCRWVGVVNVNGVSVCCTVKPFRQIVKRVPGRMI